MTAPETPVPAVAAASLAAGTGPRPRALQLIPVFGPCVVCGIDAMRVAVYAHERHVHHVASTRKPYCVLPNPPARKDGKP